ncbi:MAG: hypothetical protein ABL958_21675, partial [Bdellovibrionia bacterium]
MIRILGLLFVFVLVFLPDGARADARANTNPPGFAFQSPGGSASATVNFTADANGTLDVTDRRRKRKISLSKKILMNFDFHPSDDGKYVVGNLKDSFYGAERNDRPIEDRDALVFIDDEKIIKKYSFSQLMKDQKKAWLSVSHTHWLFDRPKADFAEDTLLVMTNDGLKYDFKISTG